MKVYYIGTATPSRGTVMKIVGTRDVSALIPNAFGVADPMVIAAVDKALATDLNLTDHALVVLTSGVDGSSGQAQAARLGDAIAEGLFSGMDTTGASQGDGVFISDLGAMSLLPGTNSYRIGEVQSTGIVQLDLDSLSMRQPVSLRGNSIEVFEDFLLKAGATIALPWNIQDTSAAGTPTKDYVSNALGGQFKLQHDNTNEVQNIGLNWNDHLAFDITKKPILEVRLKIDGTAAAAFGNGIERLVVGFASARNATLNSVTTNAWFRIEGDGSTRKIKYETDDNTTDSALTDSTKTYAEGTFVTLRVDCSDLTAVAFYVNGAKVGTLSMAAATGNVQPFVELQKDSGTGTIAVTIDYISPRGARA